MSIDDMKRIELEIMDEIHRVCIEHGVRYNLFYGSLLGAVRHGGFIPWDDDIDIVMMRDDYERFIANFNEWRSSDRFSLATYRDGVHPFQFTKIYDSGTYVEERYTRFEHRTGVWVDVFPFDYYDPSNTAGRKKVDRAGFMRSLILTNPKVGSTTAIRLAKKLVCPFAGKLDPLKYCKIMDEESRSLAPNGSDTVIGASVRNWMSVFPVEMFEGEPSTVAFEDREYLTVADKERALELMYGDWRTPPPPEKQIMHTMGAYYL